MSVAPGVLLFAAAVGAVPLGGRPSPRESLAGFGRALEAAVRRVSRASGPASLGPASGCRSYAIPGYGVVFVLPPRVLPGQLPPLWAEQGPELARALQALEAAAARIDSPEARRAIEGHLARLRARLGTGPAASRDELQAVEQRAQEAASEAERTRLESELALESVRQGLVRREATPAEAEPQLPPPPPWQAWFDADDDRRTPDALVEDVRAAVASVLESEGARLQSLAAEDHVVVAVDFVPRSALGPRGRAERTLVLRVRVQDLRDRRQGRLGPEELRRRILAEEY